jgi:hypothetical protein
MRTLEQLRVWTFAREPGTGRWAFAVAVLTVAICLAVAAAAAASSAASCAAAAGSLTEPALGGLLALGGLTVLWWRPRGGREEAVPLREEAAPERSASSAAR